MDTVLATNGTIVRFAWAALAVAAGVGLWQVEGGGVAFATGLVAAVLPDVPLAFGAGRGLARGQLHARAVPSYNAVHAPWGPLAVLAAASTFDSTLLLAVGLGWAAHIALDRSLGYGPRTPEGFQRG